MPSFVVAHQRQLGLHALHRVCCERDFARLAALLHRLKPIGLGSVIDKLQDFERWCMVCD